MKGIDQNGIMHDIDIKKGEEVTAETFLELTKGKGDMKDE